MISIWLYGPIQWWSTKGRGTKELEQLKYYIWERKYKKLLMITEKNEKKKNVKLQLSIPGTQGTFSDKFTPEIYGFTAK